ncbi:hypothetical protein [Streptomyces sp. CAU 1734]|uniref:hypothetical protein n=1 Tax=Streptomyces sp. CAU 1734 TaxID=3140360 RepID=UPI003260AB71
MDRNQRIARAINMRKGKPLRRHPNPELLALLTDTESYLSALHSTVHRHDNLGADLGCAGCALLGRIKAALAQDSPDIPHTEIGLDHAATTGRADPGAIGETASTRDEAVVHACPGPDDQGISPCCGRPPFEFRGERLTRDPALVTCPGLPGVAERPAR